MAERERTGARVASVAEEAERVASTPARRERANPVLGLQRRAGNATVVGLLGAGLLGAGQAKLEVGAADDPAELEADAVAHDVVARLLAGTGGAPASGDEVAEAAPGPAVRRRAEVGAAGGPLGESTERAIGAARGGGQALPGGVRRAMEGAFGADFGGVRLHSGERAAELNEAVQASAFTVGNDIFFRGAVPDTTSRDGQELLAHELTHTIQQGAAPVPSGGPTAGERGKNAGS